MPPARSSLFRRRRSSLAIGLTQVKPGNYGINPSIPPRPSPISPRALTFAPNVTPGTYVEVEDDMNDAETSPSPSTALFPPTEPHPAPTRRRLPPGKRLSQGYIPRPPNAFMLFRANFVRQKHVPGSIETNHGSLSKIIGNCWRALPLEEKKYWEVEARKAKAAHRERYPNYRFRPVHNKNKNKDKAASAADKRKEKLPPQPADEERCEVVAQLLLDGKKGEELAEAIRQIDMARALSRPESVDPQSFDRFSQPPLAPQPIAPMYLQRRPSSVPPIALPTLPFLVNPGLYGSPNGAFNAGYPMGTASLHESRAPSPVGNIARTRTLLGMRRASSCQPIPSERMWDGYDPHPYVAQPHMQTMPAMWQLQPDWSPLPEVTDASIFQPGWTNSFKDDSADPAAFDPNLQAFIPPDAPAPHELHLNIGPLDNYDFSSAPSVAPDAYSAYTPGECSVGAWPPESSSSSACSGSPARSDASLPGNIHAPIPVSISAGFQGDHQVPAMCAPQPQHPQVQFDAWTAGEPEADSMYSVPHAADVMHGDEHQQNMSTLPVELELDGGYAMQYDMYADSGMVGLEMEMSMGAAAYGYGAAQEY